MSSPLKCFHCEKLTHWKDNCPLLVPPAGKAEHEERLAEIKHRFLELEIGPVAKQRMMKKENSLWKAKQKEMARK